MLRHLPRADDPNLLVGTETHDDAGVYRISADLALIQTIDYFTPIVDDPRDFGAISAANSLSDVYAMGGSPLTAMNVVGWPEGQLGWDVLRAILEGAHEVIHEAGAVLVGGHSVKSPELFFGLSVTGIVHPERVVTNAGARPGDRLFLTKPIGTGILSTAQKHGSLERDLLVGMTAVMRRLNAAAAEAMLEVGVHAATDVTGFGLLGHLHEMMAAAGTAAEIDAHRVPLLPGAIDHARAGRKAGGLHANRRHVAPSLETDERLDEDLLDLLCDPQTSGGLLIAVPPASADRLEEALARRGIEDAGPIGSVVAAPGGAIRLRVRG